MIAKVNVKNKNVLTMPVIAMRGLVLFPQTINQFDIGRERSIKTVEWALKNDSSVFLCCQRDLTVDDPEYADLYEYGVVANVKQVFRISEDYVKVLVECQYRAKLLSFSKEQPHSTGTLISAAVRGVSARERLKADAYVRSIREQMNEYIEHFPKLSSDVVLTAFGSEDYNKIAETLTYALSFDYDEKQQVLAGNSVIRRLEMLLNILKRENEVLDYEKEIGDKVKDSIDKGQRDYYLREQIRVLSEELGDSDDTTQEADDYIKRIKELRLATDSEEKLVKEAQRLRKMPGSSQEAAVSRSYLDYCLELPWNTVTEDKFDLVAAREKLDADHYGLKDVKDRIIELLAVRSVTEKLNSQILCLVGPPGVGKTSIARSIAECMGRKYVRLSLGGVHDESEIRGHRRTYVGSMPGRIIQAMIYAKSNNPLILLDEVDKLGNDYKGDPASALLEVLDPEQNFDFKDHFIEIPFDLSHVLFITTANDPAGIQAPLYDRMEIIELSSYTRAEKFNIAKKHLLRKQMEKHGLKRTQLSITDRALYDIIDNYTREAGVRGLERCIARICRKGVAKIVAGSSEKIKIEPALLSEFLGAPLERSSIAVAKSEVGVCNGLAWTSQGGVMLPVEVVTTKGSGKLELTGSLGDVMKESAHLALTLARKLSAEYGYSANFAAELDIHIHAPEGAVPKDGPSAGVTLLTALVSALSGKPVRAALAMTGEITLTGRVLAIGGLKEKLIAACKEKMHTVLIPGDNKVDLAEMDSEIIDKLNIVPVDNIADVLSIALTRRELNSKTDAAPVKPPKIEKDTPAIRC